MSLSGIFDPMVRSYFESNGGGSAVEDGYCIIWDGNREGRDAIDLNAVQNGLMLYKATNIVFSADEVLGAVVDIHIADFEGAPAQRTYVTEESILAFDEWLALVTGADVCAISAKAGTHNWQGFNIIVPSDGTYFLRVVGDATVFVSTLAKPASV